MHSIINRLFLVLMVLFLIGCGEDNIGTDNSTDNGTDNNDTITPPPSS